MGAKSPSLGTPSENWTTTDVSTPVGTLRVSYRGRTIRSLDFLRETTTAATPVRGAKVGERFPRGSPPAQIQEYFEGKRKEFEFDPDWTGATEFDTKAWTALREIPFGETRTYGELARTIGRPAAARAVGGAMHRNPIALMVPCHRVVGHNGSLTGFGPGLGKKEWLLRHEQGQAQI